MLSAYIYVCYLVIEEGLYPVGQSFQSSPIISDTNTAKIDCFLSIGAAFNSLLSSTSNSVNLIGPDLAFISAQFSLPQPQPAGQTLDAIALFDL